MVDSDATRNTHSLFAKVFLIFLYDDHKDLLAQSHQCGTPDPTSREMDE
jgi:hypothetical protein